MDDTNSTGDHHECRHCSGLCAGRASKCPYCKRWLRREAAELTRGDDVVERSRGIGRTA